MNTYKILYKTNKSKISDYQFIKADNKNLAKHKFKSLCDVKINIINIEKVGV